jgi:hypothetical protein
MGRKTKPWTHPRKHPNNSQKGSIVAFGMTKKTGFLASQDTGLINQKTPDCTLSKTEKVQFFAGSSSTWPLLSQNYIESYSPLPVRYKYHWQQEDLDCWYTYIVMCKHYISMRLQKSPQQNFEGNTRMRAVITHTLMRVIHKLSDLSSSSWIAVMSCHGYPLTSSAPNSGYKLST